MAEIKRELEARGIDIIEGPVERTGAEGTLSLIYFREPQNNLVEFSNYV